MVYFSSLDIACESLPLKFSVRCIWNESDLVRKVSVFSLKQDTASDYLLFGVEVDQSFPNYWGTRLAFTVLLFFLYMYPKNVFISFKIRLLLSLIHIAEYNLLKKKNPVMNTCNSYKGYIFFQQTIFTIYLSTDVKPVKKISWQTITLLLST